MLWSRSFVIQSEQQPQQGAVSFSKPTGITDATFSILEMPQVQSRVEQDF